MDYIKSKGVWEEIDIPYVKTKALTKVREIATTVVSGMNTREGVSDITASGFKYTVPSVSSVYYGTVEINYSLDLSTLKNGEVLVLEADIAHTGTIQDKYIEVHDDSKRGDIKLIPMDSRTNILIQLPFGIKDFGVTSAVPGKGADCLVTFSNVKLSIQKQDGAESWKESNAEFIKVGGHWSRIGRLSDIKLNYDMSDATIFTGNRYFVNKTATYVPEITTAERHHMSGTNNTCTYDNTTKKWICHMESTEANGWEPNFQYGTQFTANKNYEVIAKVVVTSGKIMAGSFRLGKEDGAANYEIINTAAQLGTHYYRCYGNTHRDGSIQFRLDGTKEFKADFTVELAVKEILTGTSESLYKAIMHSGQGLRVPAHSAYCYVPMNADTGPELLPNVDFADLSHITGQGNPKLSVKNGWLNIEITDNGYPYASMEFDTVVGKDYTFSCDGYKNNTNYIAYRISSITGTARTTIASQQKVAYGGMTVINFKATTTKTEVRFYVNGKQALKKTGIFKNPTVKEIITVHTKSIVFYNGLKGNNNSLRFVQLSATHIPKSTHAHLSNMFSNLVVLEKTITGANMAYLTDHPEALMDIAIGIPHAPAGITKADMKAFYPCTDKITINGAIEALQAPGAELLPNVTFADTTGLDYNNTVCKLAVANNELTVSSLAKNLYPYALMRCTVTKGKYYVAEVEMYNVDASLASMSVMSGGNSSFSHSYDEKTKGKWSKHRLLMKATGTKMNLRLLSNCKQADGSFKNGHSKFKNPTLKEVNAITVEGYDINTRYSYCEKSYGPQVFFHELDHFGMPIKRMPQGHISGSQYAGGIPMDGRWIEVPVVDPHKKHRWIGGQCLESIKGDVTGVVFKTCTAP